MKPTFKNRPNELITTTDGRKIWVSRSVAVVMVLCCHVKEKYYFAIEKRGTSIGLDKPGFWCLPCGYIDYSETGIEAIKRELWEEIGINLDEYCVLDKDAQPWYVKTNPDENRQNITLRYGISLDVDNLPKLIPGNDAELNEVAEAKWITIGELKDYDFAFNHDDIIRLYATKEDII